VREYITEVNSPALEFHCYDVQPAVNDMPQRDENKMRINTIRIPSFDLTEATLFFTTSPQNRHWGAIMTHIKDCSGNTFSVVQRQA